VGGFDRVTEIHDGFSVHVVLPACYSFSQFSELPVSEIELTHVSSIFVSLWKLDAKEEKRGGDRGLAE
jgi:hypothetical protein